MTLKEQKRLDLDKIMESDPAAFSRATVRRTYTGYKALCAHRRAYKCWQRGWRRLALHIAYRAKVKTGIDIHPAAKIGNRVFIDHGVGVVIGETTEIGNDVVLYQGVTLGGTGKETGKRHPTIEDCVMVSAGAKVLGPVRIGAHSKIGAGSVVLKDVPPHSTVVGVPGRIVKQAGVRVDECEMDQVKLPDPIMDEFSRLYKRICVLEEKIGIECCRYSLTTDCDNNSSDSQE